MQDAETLLPFLCKAAPLEAPPEVASESEADGVPSDQTTVESSSTAVTDTSNRVPVKIVVKSNDMTLPDLPTTS